MQFPIDQSILNRIIDGIKHVQSFHRNKPNTKELRETITHETEVFLALQSSIEKFAVVCDERVHTSEQIADGTLCVVVKVLFFDSRKVFTIVTLNGRGSNLFAEDDYDRAMAILEPRK